MANIKDFIKKIGNSAVSLEEQQQALAQVEQTIIEAKQKRTEAVGKNADMVIQALKTIEAKLEAKLNELNNTPAKQGVQGPAGQDGTDGKDGKAGRDGISGKDGTDGKDGVDGKDGISVVDAKIDFDGSLVVYLSNGSEIDCGQILQPEVAKNIIISSGGSGTSQVVTDTLVSLQNQINTLTGIDGVLGDMAQQNANAVAITGGTINNTSIGATTPSSVNATTITGQTARLNGTGQNLLLQSNSFTAWNTNSASVTVTGSQPDPFSGSTASLVVASAAAGTHILYNVNNPFSSLSLPFTVSVYVKASGYSLFYISDFGSGSFACSYNLSAVSATPRLGCTGTITSVGSGWFRVTLTTTAVQTANSRLGIVGYPVGATLANSSVSFTGDGTSGVVVYGAQVEFGSTAGTYLATTSTAVYGTPTLSFSGVSTIGLESNGSLFVQPAGTGALQAQATTSTTAGGNARGARAVDWQTERDIASRVASATSSVVSGGSFNTASSQYGVVAGGGVNTASGFAGVVSGGYNNTASGIYAGVGGGQTNTASGYYGFVGNGFTNSTTSNSAVTTQSGTMNATTAVTLSGSNANIKVGQYITGTSIASDTYVAAISGTALTLSKVASGSSTSTLSFFTPHGVVVGGGNNQATGAYSAILGGGDAGTAANRNVASGDWSFVGGGRNNTASGNGSVICGGGLYAVLSPTTFPNVASGNANFIGAGISNTASGDIAAIVGGQSNTASGSRAFVGAGGFNTANSQASAIMGGALGNTRSIIGSHVFPACNEPIAGLLGITQTALLVLAVQTTDATATALRSNTSAAGTTNQVILPNNSAYYFRGEVISGVTGGGDTKGFTIEGVIKRGANAASTALVGTPTVTSTYADAGASAWAIAVTADTTNGGIRVTFTGQAATTIRTVCQIRTTEMTY